MNDFAYVLITPYSLYKSRTGGIIGRLLSYTSLELCSIKMYAPSNAMVDDYIHSINKGSLSQHNKELFCKYIENNLRPNSPSNISNRCLLLLFKGKNAADTIRRIIGHVTYKPKSDTVRGTFGDYIMFGEEVIYFEPAVICASGPNEAMEQLKIFTKYEKSDSGVITNALFPYIKEREDYQTTLVMLKPDTFKKRSSRPGNIIDYFSKTGLFIIGARLVPFSIAQAKEFYGPLKEIFITKLEKIIREKAKSILAPNIPFKPSENDWEKIGKILREKNAAHEFKRNVPCHSILRS